MTVSSDIDLFSDEVLADPHPHWRELRSQGPVVRLDAHDVFALPRYDEVRAVLADDATFCSGQGIGFNPLINGGGGGATIMSDGDVHRLQREVIGRPLTPKALASVQPRGQQLADGLVDALVERGRIDAATEVAEAFPLSWGPDLLGLPTEGRDRLLEWAGASFQLLGPLNDRAAQAAEPLLDMAVYAQDVAGRPDTPPGTMVAGIRDACERGEVGVQTCPTLVVDYLTGAFQTTVSALGSALWLFATHPEQWERLRAEPARVKNAFNEVLRLESPITMFSRVATVDTAVGGVELPAGSRVAVMFGSANRDERRWDRAEEFDIGREAAGHLAFGYGVHACAGMGLARMQGAAVLEALVARVSSIELDGTPVRAVNNTLRCFESVPVRLHPA